MLILSENHLIHVIRKIIAEGGSTGSVDNIDLNDEKKTRIDNKKIKIQNTHKMSEFLLDTLNRNSAEFSKIFKQYVSYLTKYERGNILNGVDDLLKVLKSDDFKTQLSYSKVDNYKDLCNIMLQNKNWSIFVNWFLTKSKNKRTLTLDTIKIPNKNKKEITSFP